MRRRQRINRVGSSVSLLVCLLIVILCQGCAALTSGPGPIGVHLRNNPSASDPTWDELMDFLVQDPTDEYLYIEGIKECSDFAEELHNNAEAQGTKAGYVEVWFVDSEVGHALNVFQTTDRGLVYVDCTGRSIEDIVPVWFEVPFRPSCEKDTIAYLEVGREYGIMSISVAESPSYASYEAYSLGWEEYETALEEYNSDVAAYNALYDSCGGVASPGACSSLTSMYDELEEERSTLDAMLENLGYCAWETLGVVSEIDVYW